MISPVFRPAMICAISTTTCIAGIGYALANGLVRAFDRTLRAQDFPIGIDVEGFAQMAVSAKPCGPVSASHAACSGAS